LNDRAIFKERVKVLKTITTPTQIFYLAPRHYPFAEQWATKGTESTGYSRNRV